MATDNFIEKYLPFKVQEQISNNLKVVMQHLDKFVMNKVYHHIDDPALRPKSFDHLYQTVETTESKKIHEVALAD